MKRAEIAPRARVDLVERGEYLESHRRGYAHRFRSAFKQTVQRIARRPGSVALYETTDPRLQEMRITPIDGFPKFVILFRATSNGVQVLRVLHGAQNINAMTTEDILPGE